MGVTMMDFKSSTKVADLEAAGQIPSTLRPMPSFLGLVCRLRLLSLASGDLRLATLRGILIQPNPMEEKGPHEENGGAVVSSVGVPPLSSGDLRAAGLELRSLMMREESGCTLDGGL